MYKTCELKKIVDKTDRILKHFKNCENFQSLYDQKEKDEIFSVNSKQKTKESTILGIKRKCKQFLIQLYFIYCYVII